jgi:hypothetical protein
MMDRRTKIVIGSIVAITVIALVAMAALVLSQRAGGGKTIVPPKGPGDQAGGQDGMITVRTTNGFQEVDWEQLPEGFVFVEAPWTPDAPSAPTPSDADSDGLADEFETSIGSDPSDPDSDGDGITDADDYVHASGPTVPDATDPRASRGQ